MSLQHFHVLPRMPNVAVWPEDPRHGQLQCLIVAEAIVVVDDDESVSESLPDLLRALGFAAHAYPSAAAFRDSPDVDHASCLLLDITMPDMSGPDLLRELRRQDKDIPVVFITAHGDATTRPRMLEEGAVECLFKPFSEAALLAALNRALEHE